LKIITSRHSDGGYDGYSMSNRAVQAYEDGLVPASKIREVPTPLIQEFCRYAEWHHTSSQYNRTNFYDPEYVLSTFGIIENEEYPPNPLAIRALQEWNANKSQEKVYENCAVTWLEWSGTRRHPHAEEKVVSGCRVSVKGQTATIVLPNGNTFKKRLTTKGFSFISEKKEEPVVNNEYMDEPTL
jgi:hypothetical protein